MRIWGYGEKKGYLRTNVKEGERRRRKRRREGGEEVKGGVGGGMGCEAELEEEDGGAETG